MRKKFGWSLDPTEEEIKEIWDEGVLTLDANVLLDLYRYHEDTRDALINALENFKGRIWISHQAADEFFKNRKRVIVEAGKAFQAADNELDKLEKSLEDPINSLINNRTIPDEVANELRDKIHEYLGKAHESIAEFNKDYPDYLEHDPILDKLLELFEDSVGENFKKEDIEGIKKEAKRRIDNEIPPGYLDAKKSGGRPYGDYFMWKQMLDYASQSKKKKSLIFVTSENKEDWWEKSSGKTLGIQYELQKEVKDKVGKRFLFYRTDRFLKFYNEQSGQEANESALAEILRLVNEKSKLRQTVHVIAQSENYATPYMRTGILTVDILKPTYSFTCSGHLEPEMEGIPNIMVKLLDSPENIPAHSINAGTGTVFDFNIHVRSTAQKEYLPAGIYRFEYWADLGDPDFFNIEKDYPDE